jgi:hypothetical protein
MVEYWGARRKAQGRGWTHTTELMGFILDWFDWFCWFCSLKAQGVRRKGKVGDGESGISLDGPKRKICVDLCNSVSY